MKKLMIFLIMICFAGALSAQSNNTFKYEIKANGGIAIGTGNEEIDSAEINTTDDIIYFFNAGDTLNPYIPVSDQLDLSDYAVMLLPDTLHLTASDTLDATYNGRDVFNYASASIRISIPASLTGMPVGTTVNFFQEAAGKFVFNAQAGVTIVSPLDSIATKQKGDVVGLKKVAANKYRLYGNLTD